MNRIINSCDKSIVAIPANPIVVGAAASTDVLADLTGVKGEYAARYLQNVGANDAYYAIGQDCSPNSYHGIIQANGKQQLDCSSFAQRVSVYSVVGTTIAVCVLRRLDFQTSGQIVNNPV